jgi:hypothetical protein
MMRNFPDAAWGHAAYRSAREINDAAGLLGRPAGPVPSLAIS